MDYIEVFKDVDIFKIVGVHCNFALSEIIRMGNEFESYTPEEVGIYEDGFHTIKPIFHEPEYFDGALVNGSWYDFINISHDIQQLNMEK